VKYIFLAGAPGSKWSSVANDLRQLDGVNNSDVHQGHYTRDGEKNPMHVGAYWDPGMSFGANFDRIPHLTTAELEYEFDRPFQTVDDRPQVIKSHQFSKWLEQLQRPEWEYNPIVIVQRPAEDAERWWHRAGGWNITYPSYEWYRGQMHEEIVRQCEGIDRFIITHDVTQVHSVRELAATLGMATKHNRRFEDFNVFVYVHPRLRYFKDAWRGNITAYEYSGMSLLDQFGPEDRVLDVGCGANHFKPALRERVVGIDPINPAADIRVSIDEYRLREQFDHVLCLGSINFGTRLDIERQCRRVVECTRPGGLIHWRLNPGRYDHGNPGQEHLDLFKWGVNVVYEIAKRNGCDVEECVQDSNNRLYSKWRKM
jgi:hypothetical protein